MAELQARNSALEEEGTVQKAVTSALERQIAKEEEEEEEEEGKEQPARRAVGEAGILLHPLSI